MVGDVEHIRSVAEPLIKSDAFSRLRHITFLGILSPRYCTLSRFPFANLRGRDDGNRAQHSLAVTSIILNLTSRLGLSTRVQRYAAAWGLVHDIATWPLSHTGEAAFSETTKIKAHRLRQDMIEGANWLPRSLSVFSQLKKMQIDPGLLLELTKKGDNNFDTDLRILHRLIHSPITPDTLEGMVRSGAIFGVRVPRPEQLASALYRDVFSEVMIEREASNPILQFWRTKNRIYNRYINSSKSIEFESSWACAIEESFHSVSAVDSLLLSEREVVWTVLSRASPRFKKLRRYKHPLNYKFIPELSGKRLFRQSVRLSDLQEYLVKEESRL